MKNKKNIGLLTIIIIILLIWCNNKRLPLISSDIVKSSAITVHHNKNKYIIETPEKNIPNYSETKCDNIDMSLFFKREYAEQEKTKYGNIDTSNNTFYEIDLYSNVEYLTSMIFHTDYRNRVVYIKLDYMYSRPHVRYEEVMYFDYETGLISHCFRKSKYHSGFLNDHGDTEIDQKYTIICGNRIIKSVHRNTETKNVDIHTKEIINGGNIIKSVYGMRELSNKIIEQIKL